MISFMPKKVTDPRCTASGFISTECIDPVRLSKCMANFVYSPCVWKNGVRAEGNFMHARWCVLDFDDGETTLEQAMNTFCDMHHVIGTTKSHRKDGVTDRFRVALLFEKQINDIRVYKYNMKIMIDKYGSDAACKDAARFFWPCIEIVSVSEDATYSVDVKAPPPDKKPRKNRFEKYAGMGVIPVAIQARLKEPFKQGERNTRIFGLAKDMIFYLRDVNATLNAIIKSPCSSGLCEKEIKSAVESAAKAVIAQMEERKKIIKDGKWK